MYKKRKLPKRILNNILKDLEIIHRELKEIVNRKIEEMRKYPPFQKTIAEYVESDDQKIPTRTKLLQNFFNDGIMEISKKYDLDIVAEDRNGHDYKMNKEPVEYKVNSTVDKAAVASGNKNGGTKSPLLLSMKYEFDYELNEVTKISTCFIDEREFRLPISGWKDCKGSSSWCHFKVANDDMKYIHFISESVTWKRGHKYGQFV